MEEGSCGFWSSEEIGLLLMFVKLCTWSPNFQLAELSIHVLWEGLNIRRIPTSKKINVLYDNFKTHINKLFEDLFFSWIKSKAIWASWNVHVVNSSSNFKFCLQLFQPSIFILQVEIKTHYNLDAQLEILSSRSFSDLAATLKCSHPLIYCP